MKISLKFPSKILKCDISSWKRAQLCKDTLVMFKYHSLVNLKVYWFGEISLSFK